MTAIRIFTVTGYGRAILYHNNGNGTFTDVTAKLASPTRADGLRAQGGFDYRQDGWLDLVRYKLH